MGINWSGRPESNRATGGLEDRDSANELRPHGAETWDRTRMSPPSTAREDYLCYLGEDGGRPRGQTGIGPGMNRTRSSSLPPATGNSKARGGALSTGRRTRGRTYDQTVINCPLCR